MNAQEREYFVWTTGAQDRLARRQVQALATKNGRPAPLFADGVNLLAVEEEDRP